MLWESKTEIFVENHYNKALLVWNAESLFFNKVHCLSYINLIAKSA